MSLHLFNKKSSETSNKVTAEIKRYIENVAAGDFNTKLEINIEESPNELVEIVSSLHGMSDRLKELFNFMDTNIKEKSGELSNKVDELNRSNRAILNLLEDIEGEKAKAEDTVVLRTRELSDERARLLSSINSLSWGFVIADVNNVILLQNPAMNYILEVESKLKTINDINILFDGVNLTKISEQCIAQKKTIAIKDFSFKKKFLRLSLSPVVDSTHTIGYVFIAEDITEAKVMERSREEFFAVASHELRTPLTAIRGNVEMILDMFSDKITDNEVKEMLNDVNASSVRLIEIVNDFLEVSRLEQGKVELKFETFKMQDIVAKVVRDLQSVCTKKGITLTYVETKETIPEVRGDKNRIEQVLINLIGNSVKFTAKGGVKIQLETIDKFLKIIVSDTGLGISEQNQSRLFRKFQQAGESMLARDVTQGTGLGLYISQLIISGMGGSIGLEKSVLGVGSTFAFTVPIASQTS